MSWLIHILKSPIGKKFMMALTGLAFSAFLAVHLLGNFTIYAGRDWFNSYAHHLHSLGPLVTLAEWALLLLAVVHVLTGLTLFYENLRARPERYCMKKAGGGRTVGSATMPYTGLILLAFIVFHLVNFHFVDKGDRTIFDIVSQAFAQPAYVFIYVIGMAAAGIHVSHGVWSAFQTLGANHPKYMPAVRAAGILFSLIVGIGFGSIPIYLYLST